MVFVLFFELKDTGDNSDENDDHQVELPGLETDSDDEIPALEDICGDEIKGVLVGTST